MIRALPVLLALVLTGCGAAAPALPPSGARPLRVFSANLCTDQIVLALLPPARIASVSWLARDPGSSAMAAAAGRVAANHGTAEEVIAERPDLVLTGSVTTPALRAMLKRLRYPMIEVKHAGSIAAIRETTRRVAAAVGEPARGEALIARMDRRLADLARHPAPPIRVVAWDRTGFAAGKGSLFDAILTAAGARNILRDSDSLAYAKPDVETLLAADPALLVQGSPDAAATSRADEAIRHPLVRRYWGARTLIVPQRYYNCGTPMIADAAWRLRADLRAAAVRARGPAIPAGGVS